MELYSNLSNYIPKNMSNEDISELYNTEFQKGEASLTQLSDYINLIEQNKIAFDNKSLNNIKKCLELYSSKSFEVSLSNSSFSREL